MKRNYSEPVLQVIILEGSDIVTTSGFETQEDFFETSTEYLEEGK